MTIVVAGLAVYMVVLVVKQVLGEEHELDIGAMLLLVFLLAQLIVWWPFWNDVVWPLVDGAAIAAVATGYHTLRRLFYRLGSAVYPTE